MPTQKNKFFKISSPDSSLFLELCPEVGGGITAFYGEKNGKKIDFFRPYNKSEELSPLNFSNFPLTPFSNRINCGKLNFGGETLEVGPPFANEAHPNHGDGWHSVWSVKDLREDEITISLKTEKNHLSPYVYYAEQTFRLEENQLIADVKITNLSGRTLPFGTGHHLYFLRTDKTILKANLPKVWESKNMMPEKLVPVPAKWAFSQGVEMNPRKLEPAIYGGDGTAYIDHCFAEWNQSAEIIWADLSAKLTIKADPMFKHFVVFMPSNNNFFCAEPVTNATDGFNLMAKGQEDTGTIILDDGASLQGRVVFETEF